MPRPAAAPPTSSSRPPATARQRGAALITAVLVTALVGITAIAMAKRQQFDIRRSEYLFNSNQAYLYALGAETWGVQILARDAKDGTRDHPGEDWAQTLPVLPVDGGQLHGRIEDLQGRFNLNNLVDGEKVNKLALDRFKRLLKVLDLEPSLVNPLLDWIDADPDPRRPDGVEDLDYLSATPPYRAADRPLVSVSELRAIKGYDAKTVAKLEPFVTALPTTTPINVNTAPVEVLLSLAEQMTRSDAESLVEARAEDGFASLADFLKRDELAGTGLGQEGLSLASNYFLLEGKVLIGNQGITLQSLVYRDDQGVPTVLMHARGAL